MLLLGLARRNFAKRPAPGEPADAAQVDGDGRRRSRRSAPSGSRSLLSVVNPKNLVLAVGAAAGLGQLGLDTEDAVVALAVFVAVASLSIVFAVVYEFVGGERARKTLDEHEGVDDRAQRRGHGRAVPGVR